MLSRSRLELASVVNSDSSWKVSKGHRTGSRRAKRKEENHSNNCSDLARGSSVGLNMPISELDKRGVAVSGCRIDGKAEHVPIKKRRFLFRSPSPPRIPFQNEEGASPSSAQDGQDLSAVVSSTPSISSSVEIENIETNPKKVNMPVECNEDFSGISILAAAACSTSLGGELGSAEEGSGIMRPEVHGGQVEFSKDFKAKPSSKGLLNTASVVEFPSTSVKDKSSDFKKSSKENSSADGSQTVSCDVTSERGEGVRSGRQHSQDDRLHWDLNVVMDAWDQPFDGSDAQTSEPCGDTNNGGITKSMASSGLINKPEKSKSDDDNISQRPVDQEHVVHIADDRKQTLDICRSSLSKGSDCKFVVSSLVEDIKPTYDQESIDPRLASNAVLPHEPPGKILSSNCYDTNAELEASLDVKGHPKHVHVAKSSIMDEALSDSTDLKNLNNPPVSEEICSTAAENVAIVQTLGGSAAVDVQMSLLGSTGLDARGQSVAEGTSSNQPLDEKHLKKEGRDAALRTPVSYENNVHTYVVDAELTSGAELGSHSSSKNVTRDPCGTGSTSSQSLRINYDEFLKRSGKRITVESFDQKYNVDGQPETYSTLETQVDAKQQEGYDSQYEDGELREPAEHEWEEYDAFDGEAEHVEYGYCNRDMYSPTVDYHVSELRHGRNITHKDSCDTEVGTSFVSEVDVDLNAKSNMLVTVQKECSVEDNSITTSHSGGERRKSSVSDEQPETNRGSSATNISVRDDRGEKVRIFSRAGRGIGSEGIENIEGSRRLRQGLPSQLEEPVSNDISFREERLGRTRSRWERESGYDGRFPGRLRFSSQGQSRARQVDGLAGYSDGRRGFGRRYSPTYHEQPKPDSADTVEDDDRDTTVNTTYIDQSLTNDGSVADGDVGAGFRSGRMLNELSSARPMGRGRFLRYGPQVDRRVGRGRYHGCSPDNSFQSSLRYRGPLSRRERSNSPTVGRGGYTLNRQSSHVRSPSRSRTRSPNPRFSPKGRSGPGSCRDAYLRHRSRSPSFRSEVRMLRTRLPHQQAGFGADRARVRPSRREHLSLPMSRWIGDRKDEVGHFRDLGYKHRATVMDRSPGRLSMRGDMDGGRNHRPDIHYRSYPGRLSEMDDTSRGFRPMENYDNRRKFFGPSHSPRRGYEHGTGRRMRRTDDDDDDDDGNYVPMFRDVADFRGRGMRGIDSQMEEIPRRFRGERRFVYEQAGKFDANSKPLRFDRMDTSRNMKSYEHYKSFRPGRFSEMDGAGRGNRYMGDYVDRRKHHGPLHPMRRSEIESVEKSLDHDVEGDIEGEQNICNEDAPGSHGSGGKGIDDHLRDLSGSHREEKLDMSEIGAELDPSKSTEAQCIAEEEADRGKSPS